MFAENDEVDGYGGFTVAVFLLTSGIVTVATGKRSNGGSIACAIDLCIRWSSRLSNSRKLWRSLYTGHTIPYSFNNAYFFHSNDAYQ